MPVKYITKYTNQSIQSRYISLPDLGFHYHIDSFYVDAVLKVTHDCVTVCEFDCTLPVRQAFDQATPIACVVFPLEVALACDLTILEDTVVCAVSCFEFASTDLLVLLEYTFK